MPSLLRWFIRRQTRRFMNGAFPGGMPGADGASSAGNRQQQQQPRRSRRKKIDPSVGEYIEFTEDDFQVNINRTQVVITFAGEEA